MNKIIGILSEAGEPRLQVIEIENELKNFQDIVDGDIEVLGITQDILILLNGTGKIMDLPHNLALMDKDGDILDVIVGDIFFCSIDGEDFASLDEDQLEYLHKKIKSVPYENGYLKVLEVG